MRWRKVTIIKEPIEEEFEKLGISMRGFCIVCELDISTMSVALRDELILNEEKANKIKLGIKKLKNNPELCKKIRKISKRTSTNWSGLSEKELQERNDNIVSLREQGLKLEEIGKKYNLSKQRIQQILSKEELKKLRKEII